MSDVIMRREARCTRVLTRPWLLALLLAGCLDWTGLPGSGGTVDTAVAPDLGVVSDSSMISDLRMVPDMECPIGDDKEWALWPMPNPPGTGLPNTASYDTTMPGIVKDRVTGLEWQREVDSKSYDWAGAKNYCAKLRLQGGCWRLPAMVELVSLLDFTVVQSARTDAGTPYPPQIDVTAFPNAPSDGFWTSSPLAEVPSAAWSVYFDTGTSEAVRVSIALRARCVR